MLDAVNLKEFSQQDLAILGLGEIAYVRPVHSEGKDVFAVMGANGEQLGLAPDFDSAVAAAFGHELLVVPLH